MFAQLPQDVQGLISGETRANAQTYLSTLSQLALQPPLTAIILTSYEPVFAELVARWPSFAPVDSIAGAFGRILPLEPYLIVYAQEILSSIERPQLLHSIAHLSNTTRAEELEGLPVESTRENLLSLYRLLMVDREAFVGLIDPIPLFSLLGHPNRAIRYLVIKILAIYMNSGDAQEEDMVSTYLGVGPVLDMYEGVMEDYGFLV